MTEAMITALLVTALAGAAPLMLAALGETLGEQAGVLNVGLEGVMLIGAYFAFATTVSTDSFWAGALAGAFAGATAAVLMVVFAVLMGVNQIVVGIGLLLLGAGVTSMLYDASFAASKPRLGVAETWAVPWLSDIPVLGSALFSAPVLLSVAIALAVLVSLVLHRTAPGLRLRAAGQRPASLDAAGGNVVRTRTGAVLAGGALAGLGGAYLALISAGSFTPGMTHGLGFLAIVVAMLGRGRVLAVSLISLAYGLLVAAGTASQLIGVHLPNDVIRMVPFAAVLVALALFGKRQTLPPALATPYRRGSR